MKVRSLSTFSNRRVNPAQESEFDSDYYIDSSRSVKFKDANINISDFQEKTESRNYYSLTRIGLIVETALLNIEKRHPSILESISMDGLNKVLSLAKVSREVPAISLGIQTQQSGNDYSSIQSIIEEEIEGVRRISEGKSTVNKA